MARRSLAVCLCAALIAGVASFGALNVSSAVSPQSGWRTDDASDSFILEDHDGVATCRPASSAEAANIRLQPLDPSLHVISRGGFQPQTTGGLNIVLQGTTQLDGFPAAKDAFLRAAETWKSKIDAPITVIIQVDFGPTRFGTPYGSGVLGSTSTQSLFSADGYGDIRTELVNRS